MPRLIHTGPWRHVLHLVIDGLVVHWAVVDLHALLLDLVLIVPAERVLHPVDVITVGEVLTCVGTTGLL